MVSDAISQRRPKSHPSTTVYVYLLTLMACLGGLLFGYDTGNVSRLADIFIFDNIILLIMKDR